MHRRSSASGWTHESSNLESWRVRLSASDSNSPIPDYSITDAAIHGSPRSARPRLRWGDGDDALFEGRVHQQELRRAEPVASRARRGGPSGLRPRRRRRRRDQHLRRQPDQARVVRTGRLAGRDQRGRRAHRAARGRRARLRRRIDRSARHPHRAVGQDGNRRGARVFSRAGARAPRRRRRSLRARDVPRSERDWGGDRRRAVGVGSADRRPDDDRGGRQHAGRHAARALRARARAARRDRDRRQLRGRPGADARNDRAHGGGDAGALVGAAQRRQASRRRGAQHLPVLARIHGVVRAPIHPAQRPTRRRVLRHHTRAHSSDQDRRAGRRAVAPTRLRAAGRRLRGRPLRPRPCRWRRSRAWPAR